MAMSKVMELHKKIMDAAMDLSITEEEYNRIADSCMDEMNMAGLTEQEAAQILGDLAFALFMFASWSANSAG